MSGKINMPCVYASTRGYKSLVLHGECLMKKIKKRITDEDMPSLCEFLRQQNDIVTLDLSYNNITDNGMETFVRTYMDNANNLIDLNFMYNDISAIGVKMLCESEHFNLRSLQLNGCFIGTEGVQYMSELLARNKTLKLLDLAQCDHTVDAIAHLNWALNSKSCGNNTLEILDISRIAQKFHKFSYNGMYIADKIACLLEQTTSLKEIHLQKIQFDGHDMEQLIIGLEPNTSLVYLDLGFNNIGDYGVELLAKWLGTRPNLLGLSVAGNNVRNTGARALSFIIPHSKLRVLDISHNRISEDGLIDLLSSVKKPIMLKRLSIWGNIFTDRANQVICRMLMSGALQALLVDVRIYEVDEVFYAAYYASNREISKYYCKIK